MAMVMVMAMVITMKIPMVIKLSIVMVMVIIIVMQIMFTTNKITATMMQMELRGKNRPGGEVAEMGIENEIENEAVEIEEGGPVDLDQDRGAVVVVAAVVVVVIVRIIETDNTIDPVGRIPKSINGGRGGGDIGGAERGQGRGLDHCHVLIRGRGPHHGHVHGRKEVEVGDMDMDMVMIVIMHMHKIIHMEEKEIG